MDEKRITKDEFVAILREAGLTEEHMQRFHRAFEARRPEAHAAFLAWLGIPAAELAAIREGSRA